MNIKLFITSLILLTNSLFSDLQQPLSRFSFPEPLKIAMETLSRLPEGRHLLIKATDRGPITILFSEKGTDNFGGLWNGNTRTITIQSSSNPTLATKIQTLAIELHNAMEEPYLNDLWRSATRGKIAKERFVEESERWEHNNLLRARDLIALGVSKNLFPIDANLFAYDDFDSHYMLQQLGGHSHWYAAAYDRLTPLAIHTPYKGTIPNLEKLTADDRIALHRYLHWRNDLSTRKNIKGRMHEIQLELALLNNQMRESGSSERLNLLKEIFKGVPQLSTSNLFAY